MADSTLEAGGGWEFYCRDPATQVDHTQQVPLGWWTYQALIAKGVLSGMHELVEMLYLSSICILCLATDMTRLL